MRPKSVGGLLMIALICLAIGAQAGDVPAKKRTQLGLYLTATQAYDKWQADSDNIKILDVRTLEEYIFVGHATMAYHIPLTKQTHEWDKGGKSFLMKPNPDFVALVKDWAKPDETILVMCRSGSRSSMAVNLLAAAGYTKVYNILDGMEGDMVKDKNSPHHGKRMKNGWKNSGLPWTYDLNPNQLRVEH